MKLKRITVSINGNIDAIRKQLQEEHGIEYTYVQLIDYLINFYRKSNKPVTTFRSTT
jgi:hypothetical protein